ncbi:hypothetical protein M8J76_010063 [Diaphorina citri]|nr:hypothetical protein M8J76_010063 [Diaphorina citri]
MLNSRPAMDVKATDPFLRQMQNKTRSASICGPSSGGTGFSSMDAMLASLPTGTPPTSGGTPPTGSGTPQDSNTPSGRRRRPATRSQSAKLTSGKSVRRRAIVNSSSELSVSNQNSPHKRKGSRRGQSVYISHQRKSTAFLEIPPSTQDAAPETPDEDSYRLRSFSFTSKGIVNRGDSFRRRRSRSNSIFQPEPKSSTEPISPASSPPCQPLAPPTPGEASGYNVAMIGNQGVGKTSLISQFKTSECINAYDRGGEKMDPSGQSVSIVLNGEESELRFIKSTSTKFDFRQSSGGVPDAFVLVYSVIDKPSYHHAKNLAASFKVKFIEVSVGIHHNVDELLVGILNQIRLKRSLVQTGGAQAAAPWKSNTTLVRASMKARQMLNWFFVKPDSKTKQCENLHVL